MRTHLALAALGMSAAVSLSAATRPDNDALVYVTMHYAGRAQLQSIASRFQHLAIDEKTHSIGVEATHDELMALRRDGIDATIDDAATLRLRRAEAYWRSKGTSSTLIDGFPCYRTVAETYATMDQLAQANPTLAQVVDIGPGWSENRAPGSGHRMRALELTNRSTGFDDKPAFLDQAPWTTNATPRAMSASDGRFDETSEPAKLKLSTTGLAPGRHVVFVQGTDASGSAGTPQAVYFALL